MLVLKGTPCSSALPRICNTCKAQEITKIDDQLTADIRAVGSADSGVGSVLAGAGRV